MTQEELNERAAELYDRDKVSGFTARVVDEAHEAGLNVLELYHAANSARLAAFAQLVKNAAASGQALEVDPESGGLRVTGK